MRTLLTHNQLNDWYERVMNTRLTPLVLGKVGVGKTASARRYADKHNLQLVIVPLDSLYEMDVVGYAVPNKATRQFEYFNSTFFPVEGQELPAGKDGWLLAIDEFGNCGESMQVAAQRLIFERIVGEKTLHPKAKIIILGNTIEAGANANPISAAVLTRCAVVELKHCYLDTAEYFLAKNYSSLLVMAYKYIHTALAKDIASDLENSLNSMEYKQEAMLTDRGYEEVLGLYPNNISLTNLIHAMQQDEAVIQSMIGEQPAGLLHTAIAEISNQINAIVAQINSGSALDKAASNPIMLALALTKVADTNASLALSTVTSLITATVLGKETRYAIAKAMQITNPSMMSQNSLQLPLRNLGL